jgi:sugar phosphate isomerase/epimerase
MNKVPVLLQIYSVREEAEKNLPDTLRKIKEMGYDGIELAGLYGNKPAEIKQLLTDVGLSAVSAHVPYRDLIADMERTIQDYKEIGCKYIAVPYLIDEDRFGGNQFDQVVKKIDEIGVCCKQYGITLVYHNHDFEFAKMPDGRYVLEYLYDTINSDHLQTELDTCWIKVAGEDPVAYLRKYAGRCPVVHLKDYYKEGAPKKQDAQTGRFEFRPLGFGMQVMPELVEASIQSGAQYLVVEQDTSVGRTPMAAAELSRKYLQLLGI